MELVVGIVLLDNNGFNVTPQLQPLSPAQASAAGITVQENLELTASLPQINAFSATINHQIAVELKQGKDQNTVTQDTLPLWDQYAQTLSPNAQSAFQKVRNKAREVIQANTK